MSIAVPSLQTQDANLRGFADAVKGNLDVILGQQKNSTPLILVPSGAATIQQIAEQLNTIIYRLGGRSGQVGDVAAKQSLGYAPIFSVSDLPTSDLGPILFMEYGSLGIWQTIGSWSGYASPTLGASWRFPVNAVPSGWLRKNGATALRSAYPSLYAYLVRKATVTMTIASPGVITWAEHGRSANDPIKFSTTGALPTGLTAGTTYFVVSASITTNTFQVSATAGGAAINTSGTQSGVHTGIYAPFGDGDGSSTFVLPESRGEFPRNWDNGRGVDAGRAVGSGQAGQVESHTHTQNHTGTGAVANQMPSGGGSSGVTASVINTGATGGIETRPRNVAELDCIQAF